MSVRLIQKICAAAVLTGVLLSLAACGNTNSQSSESASSGASSSSSQAESAVTGSSVSGSSSAVPEESSSAVPSSQAPTAIQSIEDAAYKVETVKYQKDPKSNDIVVSYPQLSKKGEDYSKVNALLKSTAMQTFNAKGSAVSKLKVSNSVMFEGKGFLSVVLKETVQLGSADATRTIRVVNYDLQNGKAVSLTEMINENDDLLNALLALAKDRLGTKKGASLTKDTIKAALDAGQFYFGRTKIGFYLTLESGKEPEELAIRYTDTAKFRTSDAAWVNFID